MSKKQILAVHYPPGGLRAGLGMLLLCLPIVPPTAMPAAGSLLSAVLFAVLTAGIAVEILRHLPGFAANRPRILWMILLLPPALPRVFPIFPVWLESALYLIPLLLLMRLARPYGFIYSVLALTGATALVLHNHSTDGPAPAPLFPGILLFLLPLALCLRKPWRVFALPVATTSLSFMLLFVHLLPVYYWQGTARMTATEARERAPGTAPSPRYRPAPNAAPQLPDGFSPALVSLIQSRQAALSRSALEALFDQAPLPPEEMIRAFRVYGFVQWDRHGYHIPSEAFTMDPSEHLAPDYTHWVEKLRNHAGMDPDTLDPELLREARRHDVLLPVRPGPPRLRFSANYRARLPNGLLPRQMLTLLDAAPGQPPLTAEAYARRWDLTLTAAEAELLELAEQQYLEPVRWQAETLRPPPLTLPDANQGQRILLRLFLAALGVYLLRSCAAPFRRNLYILGGLSVWGFLAAALAASLQTLPAASRLALWLSPVSLLLLLTARKLRPSLDLKAAEDTSSPAGAGCAP